MRAGERKEEQATREAVNMWKGGVLSMRGFDNEQTRLPRI